MISRRDIVIAVSRTLALVFTLYWIYFLICLVIFSLVPYWNLARPTLFFYLVNTLFYISFAGALWCLAESIADGVKTWSDLACSDIDEEQRREHGSLSNNRSFHAFVICVVLFVTFCYASTITISHVFNLLWMSEELRIFESEFFADAVAWCGYGLCTALLYFLTPFLVRYLQP